MKIKFTNSLFPKWKKLLKFIMRTFILLLCSTVFGFTSSDILSQNTKIHIDKDQVVSIDAVFDLFRNQTDYTFIYQEDLFKDMPKVHLKKGTIRANKLLEECFADKDFILDLKDDKIIIIATDPIVTSQQTFKVSGRIYDTEGQPLPGANILEKGTSNGTQADFDGNYSIEVENNNVILVISYIGFSSQEIPLNGKQNLDVQLKEDISALEEIVVVGYGTVKKSDLTGSVGNMKAEEISKQPVTRVDQAIQGRISGVQVTTTSGAPGSGVSIRIRGGNSINAGNEPLYVIDGFIGGGDLNTINPNDIESIEVLKDASSTAIYGSRGSNGVILITTKRGSGKSGFGVTLDTYTGMQSPVKTIDLLNGTEYAIFKNESDQFLGNAISFPDVNTVANTDWQDVVFHAAPLTNTSLSIYNNKDNSNYFASFNYLDQGGIQIGSSYKRYQLRFNFDQKLGNFFRVGSSINISYLDRENSGGGPYASGLLPTAPIYNDDGTFFSINQVTGAVFNNPVAQAQLSDNDLFTNRGLGNVYAQFTPIKGLDIKSTFGFDFASSKQNQYTSVNFPSNLDANKGGNAQITTNLTRSIQNENTINYTNTFGNHTMGILGGFTYQSSDFEQVDVSAFGFSNDITGYNAIETGDPTLLRASSSKSDWTLLSGLYRFNYSYNNRYLLTLSGRNDGSSRLSEGNKWQFFPSAAVAWKISNESFLKGVKTISNLKLRASYGKTGSQSIGAYATLARLNTGTNYIGGNQVVTTSPGLAASPDLTWEVSTQTDIGLDLGLFKNRLNFEIDYYSKETNDLLLARELAFQTGFSSRLENVGSIKNQGIDMSINGYILDNKDFSWSSTLTISGNRNEVLELSSGAEYLENGSGSRIIVGEPVGTFYGAKFIGLWQEGDLDLETHVPGEPKFEDLNGDGEINEQDGQIIGDPNPDFYGGWNNVFTYKDLTLSAFFDFSLGNEIYDLDAGNFYVGHTTNVYGITRDRWTPENTDTNIPRAGTGSTTLLFDSYTSARVGKGNSFFISDGSYLRLKNINIQYKLRGFDNIFKNLTIYGSATNVLTLTDYKGLSPDVNSEGTNATRRGFDSNVYPQSKVFSLGIKAEF
ncbi:MAG: TonB-dependent receptor [Arenibacter algicola]